MFRRFWNYLKALLTGKFEEVADPKIQIEQAIAEARAQHRRRVRRMRRPRRTWTTSGGSRLTPTVGIRCDRGRLVCVGRWSMMVVMRLPPWSGRLERRRKGGTRRSPPAPRPSRAKN